MKAEPVPEQQQFTLEMFKELLPPLFRGEFEFHKKRWRAWSHTLKVTRFYRAVTWHGVRHSALLVARRAWAEYFDKMPAKFVHLRVDMPEWVREQLKQDEAEHGVAPAPPKKRKACASRSRSNSSGSHAMDTEDPEEEQPQQQHQFYRLPVRWVDHRSQEFEWKRQMNDRMIALQGVRF